MTGNRSSGSDGDRRPGARGWPTARRRREPGSGRRVEPRRRGGAGWPGDRSRGRPGRVIAGVYGPGPAAGRRRPARATIGACRIHRRPTDPPTRSRPARRQRPVAATVTPRRLRERLGDGLARRGHPARTASPASTASSTSRTWRSAWSSSTTTTGCCWSASIATPSTRCRGRSRKAASRPASRRSMAHERELREETGVIATDWRELGAAAPVELRLGRGRRPVQRPRRRTTATAEPGRDRAARGPLGPVRGGPGDDPRRPDHRRAVGLRASSECAPGPRSGGTSSASRPSLRGPSPGRARDGTPG